MKIKLDENMPQAMADMLSQRGHDVSTVPEERLSGADDDFVLRRASEEGRMLMTFDTDFADVRSYPVESHAGIVVFRLADQRWEAVKGPASRLIEEGILERLGGGLAVVDENRVRFRLDA